LRSPKAPESLRLEDRLEIPTIPLSTVHQDGRDWPIRGAIVEVTPELAGIFLSLLGIQQRNIRLMHFASLVRDMGADRFLFTGQPLIFSEAGNLIDGQHRCRAGIKTGKNFRCLVIFGVPDSSYIALDVTAKRSGAETLKMKDIATPSALAAVSTWVFRWQTLDLMSNFALTPLEVDEIVHGNPGLIDSVVKTKRVARLGAGHAFPAFCHYIFSQIDPEPADEFFANLGTDVGQEERSPILALRRFMLNKGKTLVRRVMIIAFFKTWNYHRKGQKIDRLTVSLDEAIPELI
jgi:hypothetical protein